MKRISMYAQLCGHTSRKTDRFVRDSGRADTQQLTCGSLSRLTSRPVTNLTIKSTAPTPTQLQLYSCMYS